jgi:hypothetical protein
MRKYWWVVNPFLKILIILIGIIWRNPPKIRRKIRMIVDRTSYARELDDMKRHCIRDQNYNPERDIANLVTKYNLEWRIIWKLIRKELTL